ncbi:Aegerolysin [Ophiocordyceps sinensis CO18]|uniref:Aegerolysin n=1 Tax=Ophiocordyceps sinensis (strain Co18 / CGMCC 3.14243) TaxID=911162 RepID=T5AHV7_OPHSC|nr:Aegerolysin [Ophiocordyceps sinensis CO18]
MAYGQWIMLLITNSIETQIRVQNAQLNLQFYRGGNKDVEIPLAEVDQVGIPWGAEEQLSSCGRSDAAAGTMGFVDLYDEDTKVCRISWSCPWGAYPNTLKIDDYDPERSQYSVQVEHGDFTSGPIGEVFVNITPNN